MEGHTAFNSSRVTAPSRNTTGRFVVQSTTVDSSPTSEAPLLRMHGIRPDNSSRAAVHVVGLGRPDRLAEGAATGVPHSAKKTRATGCRGNRIPTVSRPAVTLSGMDGCRGTTTVSGPGENTSSNFSAERGSRRATREIFSRS